MKKINIKVTISIFVFLIIFLFSISIIIANNIGHKTNFEVDKEKIYYEIKYFDSQIIYMINLLNNIENIEDFYIDWQELDKQTINLYSYWNSVILDLNYLEIDKYSLTDFGKGLDELAVSIKDTNKNKSLSNLLKLYDKLVVYAESLNYQNYNDILLTKYNLLIAYSIAEKGNWTLTHEYILNSSNYISNVVNSMENDKYTQYNINQAYIAVKELENLVNIKNLDVFYIKYKLAIDKLVEL